MSVRDRFGIMKKWKRKKESPKNLPVKRKNQKTRFIKGCMKYRTALFFHIFLTPFTAYGILDTR